MTKFRDMTHFQRVMLLLCAGIPLLFAALTAVITARVGISYQNSILVPRTEGSVTYYEGKVDGEEAVLTVAQDGTITYRWGDTVYGPYTFREDPTAIPESRRGQGEHATGLEIRRGDSVRFRGCYEGFGDTWWLLWENGLAYSLESAGDVHEPTPRDLVGLWRGPELTHRGSWPLWATGLLITGLAAVTVLFADKMIRREIAYTVREPEKAEPSEWLMLRPKIGAVFFFALALFAFVTALQ